MAGTVRTQSVLDALFRTDGSRTNSGQMVKDLIASSMGCYSSIFGDFANEVAISNTFIPMIGYAGDVGVQNNSIGSIANGTLQVGAGGAGSYAIDWHSTVQASSAIRGTERGQITMGLWTGSAGSPTPIGGASRAYVMHPTASLRTTVNLTSAAEQPELSVASTAGFFVGDTITINPGGAREETGVIDSITPGVSLTLAAPLAFEHTNQQADWVFDDDRTIGSYQTQFAHFSGGGTFSLAESDVVGIAWVLAAQAGVGEALIGAKHASMLKWRRVG
jgi:hypothetical protein